MEQKITYQQIKEANTTQLIEFSEKIRNHFIQTILQNGGHFASNLGVVELTISLLHLWNPYQNQYIWDVGHQSYIFKMLTQRWEQLKNIRQFNNISGFPKIDENTADSFGTGHSSTAISAALGIATANFLNNKKCKTIAIVGDGALTGGMAWEALNNIEPNKKNNLLIIINDNHIGIDPNNGNIDKHLQNIENYNDNIFKNFGINYAGPIDGHNIEQLITIFKKAENIAEPQVIHVKTVKGKGYLPAETQQTKFHATNKFVKINPTSTAPKKLWQQAYGTILCNIAKKMPNMVAITPAMPSGSGLVEFSEQFPTRFFDVGIAEQHALTFAAGLATQGIYPYVNVYSTFLQRAYDQAIHDIALQNLPLTVAIDRAGLVGPDGPTHHGAFDISYLLPIPNISLFAPATYNQFSTLLNQAPNYKSPVFMRFPKADIPNFNPDFSTFSPTQTYQQGGKTLVISVGQSTHQVLPITKSFTHIQLIQLKPLPIKSLAPLLSKFNTIITVEDGSITGGIGQQISLLAQQLKTSATLVNLGIPDHFIPHGTNKQLYKLCKMDTEYISSLIS